jgi:hypothetical protein
MKRYLMACGHVSNAICDNKPVCAICYGTCDRAEVIVYECIGNTGGLEGRKAKCVYGDTIVDSRWNLQFFEYCPDKEYDKYYCGCYGQD